MAQRAVFYREKSALAKLLLRYIISFSELTRNIDYENSKELGIKHIESDVPFCKEIKESLYTTSVIESNTYYNSDFADRSKIDELMRKILRDYKMIFKIYIEENDENG